MYRHDVFNSVRGMLMYQVRLKENTAILNLVLLFLSVVGEKDPIK